MKLWGVEELVDRFSAYAKREGEIDRCLADQQLLPMALAGGQSEVNVSEILQQLLASA